MSHSPPSYVPDDAGITLESLNFLASPPGAVLRDHVAALFAQPHDPTVAQIAALRKTFPPPFVHAALSMGRIQSKARDKFPSLPYIWGPPEAVEQASGTRVAAWKAARFRQANPAAIADLCAGIGGDALSLASVAPVTAVDLSPVRIKCLELNAAATGLSEAITCIAGPVSSFPGPFQPGSICHIDPARRQHTSSGTRRSPRYNDLIPPPAFLEPLLARYDGSALKLSPAVDFESLPPGHLELISDRGIVVHALLYAGTLAAPFPAGARTATCLSDRHPPFSYTAQPQDITHTTPPEPGGFLFELDGAFTRAALAAPFAAQYDLRPLTLDGGYLLGESNLPHLPPLTGFALRQILPFSETRITDALQQLAKPSDPPGPVEVKTRGMPRLNTDQLQKTLSQASSARRTILIFTQASRTLAAIADRLAN